MLDRGKVCAWNPKKSSVISATVFRQEPKVSQISGTIFVQNSPSIFRVILQYFQPSFWEIQQHVLVFTLGGFHAQIYHGSKAVNPIRKYSANLPNIRPPWKRLQKKLAQTTKQHSSPSFVAQILLEFLLIIEMFKFAVVYTVDKKRVQQINELSILSM